MPSDKKERRILYQERREQGNCPRCGKKKRKTEKRVYCADCREFFRNYNANNFDTISLARQTIYDQRKENNQCPICGKKHKARYTNIICRKCLDKKYNTQ